MLEYKFYPKIKLLQLTTDATMHDCNCIADELCIMGYNVEETRQMDSRAFRRITLYRVEKKDVQKIIKVVKLAVE
jgi:hypothetical protein